MTNRDEVVKLIMKFCYGAKDTFIHSYPDDDTLEIKKYITYELNNGVKHMLILEREQDIGTIIDVEEVEYRGVDAVFVWTPKEIILFPTKGVTNSNINSRLTRIKMEDYEGRI